jgi:chlorite dismutase
MSERRFVQYLTFQVDRAWRQLDDATREKGRAEFVQELERANEISSYAYSTLGLKRDADVLFWRIAATPDELQVSLSRLLQTRLGHYLNMTHTFNGLVRGSNYVRRQTTQEQAIFELARQRYFIVYPFTKTIEWYLMSKEARQGMMNEHIRVGHEFPTVRQLLVYSTGIDDQEFIVAYETDDLDAFQELVIALRSTEARRYTLRDTPIFTCVYRPAAETLALLG